MALSHPETSPILWMSTGQNPCLQRERHLLEKIKNKTWWNSAQLCKLPPDIISILLPQCYLYISWPKKKPTLPSPPCIFTWSYDKLLTNGIVDGGGSLCMYVDTKFSGSVSEKKSIFLLPFSSSCWLEYSPHGWNYSNHSGLWIRSYMWRMAER